MRISDWSSDVCSSDLDRPGRELAAQHIRGKEEPPEGGGGECDDGVDDHVGLLPAGMDGGRARRGTFPPAIALPPPVCLTIRCGKPRYVPGYGGPASREAFKRGAAGGSSALTPPGPPPSFRVRKSVVSGQSVSVRLELGGRLF